MRYREKAESDNVNKQIWLSIFSYADEMGVRKSLSVDGDEKKEWMLSNRKKTSLYMEDFVLLPYLSLAPLSYQK